MKLAVLSQLGDHVMGMQNVGHHLVGAGRLEELKQLLASPGWLERKLHSYGTASAVADFRRCVSLHPSTFCHSSARIALSSYNALCHKHIRCEVASCVRTYCCDDTGI